MTAITICSDFGGSPPKIKSATLLCKKLPKCLPKWLYHFPFLPAMSECSCYSIFSPLFVFVSFMDFGHSNMCVFPSCSVVKNLLVMQNVWLWSLCQEDPLEKEMTTHSNILAWEILWTEQPGGNSPWSCNRVECDWADTHTHTHTHTHTQLIHFVVQQKLTHCEI